MFDAMQVFVHVIELGSFSEAGRVLGMAPSSVSRQIDKLESELGCKLLKRSTRYLSLTADGETFLTACKKLMSDYNAVLSSVKPEQQTPQGKLRVAVFESFGRLHICPIIAQFLKLHPQVEIDLIMGSPEQGLLQDNIDIAIRIGHHDDERVSCEMLLKNSMTLCASPSYIEQMPVINSPDTLGEHNCLALAQGFKPSAWQFKREGEKQTVEVNGALRSTAGTPLLIAALEGLGVTLLPKWMVQQEIEQGRLVHLLPEWQVTLAKQSTGDIYALFYEQWHNKHTIHALIEFMKQQFADLLPNH